MEKLFNPCDECNYSFSKQNQESRMCRICAFKKVMELEERLRLVYGECDGLPESVVGHLERHEGVDLPEPVFKARLLTDGNVDQWDSCSQVEVLKRFVEEWEKRKNEKRKMDDF